MEKLNKSIILIGSVFFFAVLFAAGGSLDTLYMKYLDKTIYYCLEQPINSEDLKTLRKNYPAEKACYNKTLPNVATDKEQYIPGENMLLSARRFSLIDLSADVDTELILVDAKTGHPVEVLSDRFPTTIRAGTEIVGRSMTLSEELVPGTYFWQGIVSYRVKDIPKTYVWESEEFRVVKQ